MATRCALYGNARDILGLLAEAERTYGKPQKVDSKLYTAWNLGMQPPSEIARVLAGQKPTEDSDGEYEEKPTVDVHETPRETDLVDPEEQLQELIQNRRLTNILG